MTELEIALYSEIEKLQKEIIDLQSLAEQSLQRAMKAEKEKESLLQKLQESQNLTKISITEKNTLLSQVETLKIDYEKAMLSLLQKEKESEQSYKTQLQTHLKELNQELINLESTLQTRYKTDLQELETTYKNNLEQLQKQEQKN